MNLELFVKRAEILHQHLADLYQTATVLPWIPWDLLPQAFKELYSTSKMVQLAAEELYQQNEELIQTRNCLETQRQHYQDLFEFAPAAYLVTDQQAIIKEANRSAANLLNIAQNFLIGKPLINFISREHHPFFYNELIHISKSEQIREIFLPIQPRHSNYFDAYLIVQSSYNQHEKKTKLHWLIRQIYTTEQVKSIAIHNPSNLFVHRPIYKYSKGENISLYPLLIWYVNKGLVKLSTFSETGGEILTGLATSGMIFGFSLTSLPIYQATALAEVELVSFYLSEIEVLPSLTEVILPKIQQRLQQTEKFLFIAVQRKVEDRLHNLLQLLEQHIGESVTGGTRLAFRLTHEDIASACGTTRVTITRLLGKFQDEGIISYDNKKHIIVLHN
jgi:PAS domain S-box-containing protein